MGVYQDIVSFKHKLAAISNNEDKSDNSDKLDNSLIVKMLKALDKFELAFHVIANSAEVLSVEEKIRLVEKLMDASARLIEQGIEIPAFLQHFQPELEFEEDFFDRMKHDYWCENYAILMSNTLKSIEAIKSQKSRSIFQSTKDVELKTNPEASLVDENYSDFFTKNTISKSVSLKDLIKNLMEVEQAKLLLDSAQRKSFAPMTEEDMTAIKEQALYTIVSHGMDHGLFSPEELIEAVSQTRYCQTFMTMMPLQTTNCLSV